MIEPSHSAAAQPTDGPGAARVGNAEGSSLSGPPAELRMTIQVKRAATGQVETFELVGHVQESENDSNT